PSSTSAPIETSKLRSVCMSRTSGMFSRVTASSVRMAAAMAGSAAFLAPLTRMVPTRGLPPRMTNLSIIASGASVPFSLRSRGMGMDNFFNWRALLKNFLRSSRALLMPAPPPQPGQNRPVWGSRHRASHAKSTVLDRFSDVSLKRLKFFLRLGALQSGFQHHQGHGDLAAPSLQRLRGRRVVHPSGVLQDAQATFDQFFIFRVHVHH